MLRDDTRQDSDVFTSVIVSACDCKTPRHAVCGLCRDLCPNNVTVMQIFGLFLAESERDVYVDLKNQVMAVMRAVCRRKR